MKRRLVVILTLLVACKDSSRVTQQQGPAPAGSADPWTQPAPVRDPLKRPLLWSLEKDGHTSYLLGTMHGGVDPTTRLPDLVWQKLDASPAFAMETDISKANLDFLRHDGKTLRDELGPEYWQKLEGALGAGAADRLLGMTPMIPATTLSMRDLPQTPPMDGVLHSHAQNAHKRLIYLEDANSQLAVLARWMNARALQDMLDDLDGVKKRSLAMLAAYVAGDEAGIQAVMQAERDRWVATGRPAAEYDAQMEDVLYRRNASWIDAIDKAHADGGVFIAVGALHALGPRSVLDLLGTRGFTVTRMVP